MIDPVQRHPHLTRREALQTVGVTVALATSANGLTCAASAATTTINVSDRNAGSLLPNGARLAVSLSLMFEGCGQPISRAGGVIPCTIAKGVSDQTTNSLF